MTSTISNDQSTATSWTPLLAAISIGTSAVLTAIGSFRGDTDHTVGEWAFTVGLAVVAAAIVFGLVVRTAPKGNAGRRALILGVVSLLSVAVFWAGITTVIGAAALACALIERDTRGDTGGMSKAGIALAALSTVAVVWLAFTG